MSYFLLTSNEVFCTVNCSYGGQCRLHLMLFHIKRFSAAKPACLFLSVSGRHSPRHTCLLDSMHIDLFDMDLFTAIRVTPNNVKPVTDFDYKSQVRVHAKRKGRVLVLFTM